MIYSLSTVVFSFFLPTKIKNNAEPTRIHAQEHPGSCLRVLQHPFFRAKPFSFTLSAFFNVQSDSSVLRHSEATDRKLAQVSLTHNKAPGLGKSSRFVVCEVKLHLARSSVLVISACPVAQYHTGSYLLMTAEFTPRAQGTFAPSKDFWVAGTCAHKHALHHAFSLVNCPRQSCSLIYANLHRTCVLVLPGGLRNLSV